VLIGAVKSGARNDDLSDERRYQQRRENHSRDHNPGANSDMPVPIPQPKASAHKRAAPSGEGQYDQTEGQQKSLELRDVELFLNRMRLQHRRR